MKKMILLNSLIFMTTIICIDVNSQAPRDITGIVTAFKNIPLNHVKVFASRSGVTEFTDDEGRFHIKCADRDKLILSASGFKEKRVNVGKENVYQIDLPYVFTDGNYSLATKNNHIKTEVLDRIVAEEKTRNIKDYSKYTSIFEAIDVEITDVRVQGTSVFNNKIKSMTRSPQVLYVVDDKIVTDISYIHPAYVKSIEFVDDVGASMYGSMGANGVLKIYLK